MPGLRRSIRLKDYDYASEGAYFVTLCVHSRKCILGSIDDEAIVLTDLGRIVAAHWDQIPVAFPHAELDEFQMMPNHLHGIICFVQPPAPTHSRSSVRPTGTASGSLGAVIQNFKKNTGRIVNRIRHTPHQPVWQRNYYEHIIRTEDEFERIREYIRVNPANWAEDPEHT